MKRKFIFEKDDFDTAMISQHALAMCKLESPLFMTLLKWVNTCVSTNDDVFKFRGALAVLNDMRHDSHVQDVRPRLKALVKS